MKSRYLSGRIAVLAATLCSLAGSIACDVPSEATPSEATPSEEVTPSEERMPDPHAASIPHINPNELYIEQIKTNGQGCPKDDPNSVEIVISDDRKSFVIIYKDMELHNPPGPKVKNLNCQAAVKLHIPGGYQVALATVNTRGYLYLDDDIRAKQTSGYFFAGVPVGAYPHSTIVGPFDDFYEFSDNIPFQSLVWSPCGSSAIFGINTSLNLNAKDNPNGEAIFSTNDTDGVFRTILHWEIRSC